MGSEPDLSDRIGSNAISRDGSFLSLASATSSSTYYTAKDDLNSLKSSDSYTTATMGSGDVDQEIVGKKSRGQSVDAGESESNSSTMEEAESLRSSDGGMDDELSSESDGFQFQSLNSENVIEVREDISRICNTIAESDGFDHLKKREIEEAMSMGHLQKLSSLAILDGGLLSNALRTRAWPLLLKVSLDDISRNECKRVPNYFPDVPEKINNLVHLDVARVLKRFPPGLTDPQQDHLQSYLTNLICSVLQLNRKAYYYQGFHDISLTFLLVSISQSAPYLAYLCLNKMIETNLDPYMEKTMDRTHDVIHVLFALIEAEDPVMYKKIVVECKCPVAFCLPWVLTWFSHTLPNDTDVFRLYDFILGSQEKLSQPYLIPIFVSAALILRNSTKIKSNELTDIASMHQRLSKLPSETESQEPWLRESLLLMKKYGGKEDHLVRRGIAIKALQNQLWNEDNNNDRRPRIPSRQDGLLVSVGRFLFVRHRWTTVSVVILGTAVLLQAKYGRSVYKLSTIKSIIQGYTPTPFQQFVSNWLSDDSDE